MNILIKLDSIEIEQDQQAVEKMIVVKDTCCPMKKYTEADLQMEHFMTEVRVEIRTSLVAEDLHTAGTEN